MSSSSTSTTAKKAALTGYYDSIVAEMKAANCWSSPRTRMQVLATTRNMFRWFAANGHAELSGLRLEDVRTYYMHRIQEVTYPKSARYTMKLAFGYLRDTGRIGVDPTPVFAIQTPQRKKLLPALEPDEVARVLDAIDRSTPVGKRDYAFVLTGAATGLRVADISGLRLKDIDWRNGTIGIVQRKTDTPVTVPLLAGVGEAISDYILHGRGDSACERIFLSHGNGDGAVSSGAMSGMFNRRCRDAGVHRSSRDGRSFHALRRSVGKRLCKAGIPVPTIAQVLGHRDVLSAQAYINLDAESLRCCALGLESVGTGGALWK